MATRQECIKAIQAEFPKHNKMAYSLAARTSETGVMLCRRAKEIDANVRANSKRQKDTHKLQYSLRCRVTESRYRQVKQLIQEDGRFPTVQAWLDWWIYVWVKNKKAACDAANDADCKGKSPIEKESTAILTVGKENVKWMG